MKIQKLLFLSSLLLMTMACQREISPADPEPADGEKVIQLRSGAVIGRAANVGVRSSFEADDQIGVIAVKATVPVDPDTDPATTPDWATAPHFENVPAAFVSNDATTPAVTTFGWGPAAEGGKTYNQYYPSKASKIYLYSYYPYAATNIEKPIYTPVNTTGATDAERQPSLAITLVAGKIDGSADDVSKKQPDILYYIPATPVSSAAVSAPFAYQHALAQICFTVKRPLGSNPCTFKKLVFKTTAKGKLNLATGAVSIIPAANRKDASYTVTMPVNADPIEDATARAIPVSTDLEPKSLNILNPANAESSNYLMVLPLTKADAEQGELVLTCNFGSETDPAKEELVDFTIPLTDRLVAFEAGKLNTLSITVSQFGVAVTASITPWGTGVTTELPAE